MDFALLSNFLNRYSDRAPRVTSKSLLFPFLSTVMLTLSPTFLVSRILKRCDESFTALLSIFMMISPSDILQFTD